MNDKYILINELLNEVRDRNRVPDQDSTKNLKNWLAGGVVAVSTGLLYKDRKSVANDIKGNKSKAVIGAIALTALATTIIVGLNKLNRRYKDICTKKCSRTGDKNTCFNQCYAQGVQKSIQLIKRDISQANKMFADNPEKRKKLISSLRKKLIHYTEIYNKAKQNGYDMNSSNVRDNFFRRD